MFNELLGVKFDKFQRMTYADAMRDYASDKDLRIPLKLLTLQT
jgi:aspartyl-tRNA synthetase